LAAGAKTLSQSATKSGGRNRRAVSFEQRLLSALPQTRRNTHESFMPGVRLSHGNLMGAGPLSIAVRRGRRQAMAQVIDMDPDTRCWFRNLQGQPDGGDEDIWPEVYTLDSPGNPAPAKPQNAQGRVLLDVAVMLAITGILASAAAFLGNALS
jgi:hypothetical protein